MSGEQNTVWNTSCPPRLRDAEAVTLNTRRKAAGLPEAQADYRDCMGVALSGGGIRSATFALGVFQGLAKLNLLKRIDFLSTVSGGGYFGSFYGRLISRENIPAPGAAAPMEQIRVLLAPDTAGSDPSTADRGRRILRWLRENGRYLAPTGSGDYLMALATMLRNWFAVQTIVLLTVVALFLFLKIALTAAIIGLPGASALSQISFPMMITHWQISISPILLAAAALFAGLLFPLAWAYWIASLGWSDAKSGLSRVLVNPFTGPAVIFALTAIGFYRHDETLALLLRLMELLSAAALLSIALWLAAEAIARSEAGGTADRVDRRHAVGRRLTAWLRTWLVCTLVLLLIGIIDTIGQTAYAIGTADHSRLWQSLTSLGASLAALVAASQKLILKLDKGKGTFSLSIRSLAGIGSLLLLFVAACGLDYIAQAIVGHAEPSAALFLPCVILGILTLLALILGGQWEFVNLSTLLPLYGARLTRAYLGASNPTRYEGGGDSVADPIPGDDTAGSDYWTGASAPWKRGGPIHLVNVTINETIDGQSQIQQQDRRGTGMAVSATGISVGVRHHRSWEAPIDDRKGHRVFGDDASPPEDLALSQWVGISGAAFSTGMGFQTSFGLSLLAGVLNVRLGYWWRSGVSRNLLSSLLFPVQRFLILSEWLARFPGTAHRHWYLSDGGHFENTAAYELIRRRLPLIIISDGGADPGYQFNDVANLVRKARIDFNTEITFLNPTQLARLGEGALGHAARHFGSLEELRPGAELQQVEGAAKPALPRMPCAALARVTYLDDPARQSWLVVLKPILQPGDPADLVNYGKLNPTFPNESTVDQFFDEAQWESYRKLGELIATRVLEPLAASPNEASGSPLQLLR